jgi:cysteine-rich repeat protein
MRFARAPLLLLVSLAAPAVATTYIVAGSGGDFTSIQAALDVAVAGDTVQVKQKGTPYFEKLTFPHSGDAGSGYITLEAFPGDTPVVDGTGVPGENMILIDSKSYVKVVGLEIRNDTGVTDGSGVRILGAGSHVEIRNNEIHDIRGSNAMGITVYATAPQPISDLVVDGNTIHDCEPAPSESLTLNGNVTDFAVTNNVIRDVNNIGIDMIGGETDIQPDATKVARHGLCAGNHVTRARSIYGGGFAGGIYVDGGRDVVLERNVVTESDIGLEIGSEHHGNVVTGVIVRNNVIYANDKAGLAFGGYASSVGRVQGCRFEGNTIYGNDTLDVGFGNLWIQFASDNVVRNNVFMSTPQNHLLASDAGNAANTLDYNVWFAPGGAGAATFTWNGTGYTGFAAYRTATGQDARSLFADPLLIAPASGDAHLGVGSPAVNAGDPAFTAAPGEVDLDGQPRVNGPRVDCGADESSICGDHVVEPGEQCDDGNLTSGDGCDANCTVTACGNGIVTAGEQCDDGNTVGGDCCGATCLFESPGSPCDDGNPCTTTDGCNAGVCAGVEAPSSGCVTASSGLLLVKDGTPVKRSLTWRWTHGTASTGDFGDPVSGGTSYALCVYERASGTPHLLLRADAPAGGTCHGKACWQSTATGVRYRDKDLTPDGIDQIALEAGTGSASLLVRARRDNLPPPGLPLDQDPSITVQLRQSGGTCWEATYAAPASRNDATQFRDTPN